jgi:hypothetical protein
VALWRDAARAECWWVKLRIWFMRTGWRPAEVVAKFPQSKPGLSHFVKFDVPLSLLQKVYAGAQFSLYVVGGTLLLGMGAELSLAQMLLGVAWMAFGLYVIGVLLENRPSAKRMELLRVLLNLPFAWLAVQLGWLVPQPLLWGLLLCYSVLSLAGLLCTLREHNPLLIQ